MLPSKTTGASPGTAAMHLALQKLQCQGLDPPFRQRHSMLRCSAASEAGRHRNGGGGLSCSQVSIAVVPRAARLCKRGWHIQKQSAQQLQQRQREGFAVRGTLVSKSSAVMRCCTAPHLQRVLWALFPLQADAAAIARGCQSGPIAEASSRRRARSVTRDQQCRA